MKTIHVNITSKKNVYFYDFWVITLLFANKIFNDNQLWPFGASCFYLCSVQLRCCVVVCLFLAQTFVIVSAQLPSVPTSACGALMESDEVRASSRSLTDRAWIFAWLKKKCQRQTADCGEIWQLPKSIMPLTHLSGAPGPGGWKRKKRGGEKRKTQRARWKSRALHLGSVSLGFSTAVTVGSVLVSSVWEKQMHYCFSALCNQSATAASSD